MRPIGPPSEDDVERLVRGHLEQLEATVDPQRILAGVRRRQRWSLSWLRMSRARIGLVAAAAVVLGVLLFLPVGSGQASAAAVLEQAREVHALPVDHCYQISMEVSVPVGDEQKLLPVPESRLWTRGDRFWIETVSGDRSWGWGRDQQGRVWLASSPRVGIRFDRDEVPAAFASACDIRGVRLETLLSDVLQGYQLSWESSSSHGAGAPLIIRAVPLPDTRPTSLREATIELDPSTRVIRRLVLHRQLPGFPVARVTFTHQACQAQSDAAYELEGHLNADAVVFTRTHQPLRRVPTLVQHFGSVAAEMLK